MRSDTVWMTAPPLVNTTPGSPFTVVQASDRTEAFSPLGNKDVGVGTFLTGPTRNPKEPRPFRFRPVNHVVTPSCHEGRIV
jgi:hypothetical protein